MIIMYAKKTLLNMKEKIEELAKVKITKGLDKFLLKTLEYFNIQTIYDLNYENSFEIVNFINSSTNKSSKSYYILRTELTENDYIVEIKKQNALIGNISKNNKNYNSEKRSDITKKRNNTYHGLGYSGWYDYNNEKYYLRSKHEFIFLNYLLKTKLNSKFKMEYNVYTYDNCTYKPDIFEFDLNDNIICIYEVKYKEKNFEHEKYLKFEDYAKNILNIKYVKLWNINKITKQYPDILIEFDKWKESIIDEHSYLDYSFNNPMLGMKQKESTKKLISEKAKKRFENEEYKENIRQGLVNFYSDKESEPYKKWLHNVQKAHSENKQKRFDVYDKENPILKRVCKICGEEFETRRVEKHWCNKNGCGLLYRIKFEGLIRKSASKENLRKCYIQRIFSYIDTIIFDENIEYDEYIKRIFEKKAEKMIPEKFGMTTKDVIQKYFGDYNNMKKEYLKYKRGE